MANKPIPECALLASALSDNDRARLRGRSRQELQHWVSVEKQALQRRLLDLESLHNSTITVNTLPDELFVAIIRLAIVWDHSPSKWNRNHMKWKTTVMAVCRHWRDTIVHTPLLWTGIYLTENLQFSDLCLTRSRDATIDWHVLVVSTRPRTIDWFSTTGSLLASHHTRIRRMKVHFDALMVPVAQPHWQLSTVSLPALVSMDLSVVGGFSSQWIPSSLPSLRRLSLKGLTIDDPQSSLSQLTSLELCDIGFPKRSLASLLDVLKTCTLLQHFVYEDSDEMPFDTQSVAADYAIPLPHTCHFSIKATSANMSSLLAHILLAKQTRVSLSVIKSYPLQDENGHMSVLNTFLPRGAPFWPAMKDVNHIMVWWDEYDGLSTSISADVVLTEFWEAQWWRSPSYTAWEAIDDLPVKPLLSIENELMEWPVPPSTVGPLRAILEELGDFFPESAKTLILCGFTSSEDIATETWAQILASFPALEYFELVAEQNATGPGSASLALALKPTSTGIPCPHLRELVLRYNACFDLGDSIWRSLDYLRAVLQERVDEGSYLETLSLQLDVPPGLFEPSTRSTATSRWPPEFEEIQRELALLVGTLEISYMLPHDKDWTTIVSVGRVGQR
ncbi:uncharacterized protein B0H18DRAFT_1214752 [Fomitopsis serialis]|uniref:uncharacterized protein n=1 Tax=Fomitopsis serialis TaxID=139415 RepID=UPI0020081851|nr:uncharacterized protein B0H18DRAFT_1214752 [Neoantrodia serialis]KAH9917179.1 hypothetical protein B0H18DRAFT_1214752 [Neoantrodia serialis]